MARFIFKLQAVLRHRELIERQRQRAVALASAKAVELQQQLAALDDSVKAATQEMRDHHLIGRLDMNYIAAHRRFVTASGRQAMGLAQKLALAQRDLDDARAVLAEAAKQRKILEKLRDRQQERWRIELDRKESAEIDEIGMKLTVLS